jgi:hypothetical protein
MRHLKSRLWVTLSVFVLALVMGSGPIQAQELARILEIERYPDEPLQLVSLRIGPQSVKENIKQKSKDPQSKWGIDTVEFNEKDDWVKRLSITLRNASDKPVSGLLGQLFFKPLGFPSMFALQLTPSKQLHQQPLQPGAEIELAVDESKLNQALLQAKSQNADLRGAVISFSLDSVSFSEKLLWYRGNMLRPDTEVPNKWVPVKQP